MKAKRLSTLRKRALRIVQDPEHPLYLFSLTAEELVMIADISRVSRDNEGKLIGYQRPEVQNHIQNIVEYLDSEDVVFPNSIILALSSDVDFKESRGPKIDNGSGVPGSLEIPLPANGQPKPAWIVDGQQRTIALARSKRRDLPVPVSAFVADKVDLQRDQFLRINNTRPLRKGLIDELLPEVDTVLPANLNARKVPSALCDLLNQDPDSPFKGIIKRVSGVAKKSGSEVVTDTVVISMLQENFQSSGALNPFRNIAAGTTDFDGVRRVLFMYWNAVRMTFPEAWGLQAEKSRLMHGTGIRAMGRLMDRIMYMVDIHAPNSFDYVQGEIARIRPYCNWTQGTWDELGLRWNEIQNVSSHVRLLSNFLIRKYINLRMRGE